MPVTKGVASPALSDLRWCKEDGGFAAARARVLRVAPSPGGALKKRSREARRPLPTPKRAGAVGALDKLTVRELPLTCHSALQFPVPECPYVSRSF